MGKSKGVVEVETGDLATMVTEKIRSVLDLADEQPFDGYTAFEQEDEEGDAMWLKQYVLPTEDWESMGKPEVITITVHPGDRLNKD